MANNASEPRWLGAIRLLVAPRSDTLVVVVLRFMMRNTIHSPRAALALSLTTMSRLVTRSVR